MTSSVASLEISGKAFGQHILPLKSPIWPDSHIIHYLHFKIILLLDKIVFHLSTNLWLCWCNVILQIFISSLCVMTNFLLRGWVEPRVGRISKTWIIHILPSVLNCVKFTPDLSLEFSRILPSWWPWSDCIIFCLLHLPRRTQWKFHEMLTSGVISGATGGIHCSYCYLQIFL